MPACFCSADVALETACSRVASAQTGIQFAGKTLAATCAVPGKGLRAPSGFASQISRRHWPTSIAATLANSIRASIVASLLAVTLFQWPPARPRRHDPLAPGCCIVARPLQERHIVRTNHIRDDWRPPGRNDPRRSRSSPCRSGASERLRDRDGTTRRGRRGHQDRGCRSRRGHRRHRYRGRALAVASSGICARASASAA